MSRAVSTSTGKVYSLAKVCRIWGVSRSGVYRRRGATGSADRKRPGPKGPCSDAELVGHIRGVLSESGFHGEGYRKVWARLRFKGIRTSMRRVLRLMRENGLLAPHRKGNRRGPRAHDGRITTDRVDRMWGTDMTGTFTMKEGQVCVFVAVDHSSMECVGIHAAKRGTRFEALEPLRQGVRERFGKFGAEVAEGLSIRHDHGSQYMSEHFQQEVAFLGMKSSPAFVREPEGNGCAEWFIKTLKENLLWVKSFDTVEELRRALHEFKRRYNEGWIMERHGYRSPSQERLRQLELRTEVA